MMISIGWYLVTKHQNTVVLDVISLALDQHLSSQMRREKVLYYIVTSDPNSTIPLAPWVINPLPCQRDPTRTSSHVHVSMKSTTVHVSMKRATSVMAEEKGPGST